MEARECRGERGQFWLVMHRLGVLRAGCPQPAIARSRMAPAPGHPASMTRPEARIGTECADYLAAQAGVLARWQATAAGQDPHALDDLLRNHRWQVLYRGVYGAFTGTPDRDAVLWAAVLSCGPEAILSHHSAAELDGLTDQPFPVVHVMTPHNQQRSGTPGHGNDVELREPPRLHPGSLPRIVVHRCHRAATVAHPSRRPPRTRVEETTLDLADSAETLDDAIAWFCRACGRRLTSAERLEASLAARVRLRWRAELGGALVYVGDGAHSLLEVRYIRDVERPHGLPVAVRQAKIVIGSRTRYLDNLYVKFGVGVELDGLATHLAEDRWRDIRRDNALAGSGIVIIRYGWADVTERPCQTAREIATVLQANGWAGRLTRCPACPRG